MSLLKNGINITKRDFLLSLLLFSIFFTSYFIFSSVIPKHIIPSSDYRLTVEASFYFVIAFTLMVSSFFVDRINKAVLVYTSPMATILLSVLLLFSPNDVLSIGVLFAIGIFLSLGLLGFLAYFWNLTVPEERGRISGLIGFVSLPLNFIVAYLVAPGLDFFGTITLSIIVNSGIIVIFLLQPKTTVLTAKKNEGGQYFEKRTVLLYLIPWAVFSLVNGTLGNNTSVIISEQMSSSSYLFLLGLQFVGVIFGCIIGGIVADFFGRRLSLALSLTSYGTSAALSGIFTSNNVLSFVYVINGLSWGILFTLYIFVVWSDLANGDNRAKICSIGLTTYYLTMGIGLLIQISIPITVSSLLTCLLVFLSIMPIMLAPELLSPYFRERMKMRQHINAVKKLANN